MTLTPPPDPETPPSAATPAPRRTWGFLLVAAGVLLLLERALPALSALVWTVVLLAGSAVFLVAWRRDPDQWWPLIPGLALLGLGVGRLTEAVGLDHAEAVTGSLLFVGLGTAFLAVYARSGKDWWAVIPGGALLGLAGAAYLGTTGHPLVSGASLFIGLAVAFLWLFTRERQVWAIFPGAAMVALAAVILGQAAHIRVPNALQVLGRYWWPLFLVVAGIWLLVRKERDAGS